VTLTGSVSRFHLDKIGGNGKGNGPDLAISAKVDGRGKVNTGQIDSKVEVKVWQRSRRRQSGGAIHTKVPTDPTGYSSVQRNPARVTDNLRRREPEADCP
jgi:hypothetical protein